MPDEAATRTWAHPQNAGGFACQWVSEIRGAQALGRRVGAARFLELRYEALVSEPAGVVEDVCGFASLPFETRMLEPGTIALAEKPHHHRLLEQPSKRRDWRREMDAKEVGSFEAIAGDLLAELGYELAYPAYARPGARARLELDWYRARIAAWKTAAYASQRSPLWRRRHPPLVAP